MRNICHMVVAGASLIGLLMCPFLVRETIAEGKNAASVSDQYEKIQEKLARSLQELTELQEKISGEKIPLSKELSRQEKRLSKVRGDYERLRGKLDSRNMDLNNLRAQIDSRTQQKTYISNLIGEYIRSLETQLHIAEVQLYQDQIKQAKLALTNESLEATDVFAVQLGAIEASMDRIEGLNGGLRFEGQAVGEGGAVIDGLFALIGPAAYFASQDGTSAGFVVEMLGSAKPTVVSFDGQTNEGSLNSGKMTLDAVHSGNGMLPVDPTLGDAHKLAQTKDTLLEHMKKGGIVMIPILALAGLALIIALIKWVQLARVKMPSAKAVTSLLNEMRSGAIVEARRKALFIKGPAGHMLWSLADHLDQPKEVVEEVMYERILETRTQLNKGLPFIAVCASSAPLLGLLGTVTGIINTFKLISAFGSGDVKTLSSGISEALVTTEFGLIVAIPSLLLHAFLNRRAKSLVDRMERIAVAVMNQLTKKAPDEQMLETGEPEALSEDRKTGDSA